MLVLHAGKVKALGTVEHHLMMGASPATASLMAHEGIPSYLLQCISHRGPTPLSISSPSKFVHCMVHLLKHQDRRRVLDGHYHVRGCLKLGILRWVFMSTSAVRGITQLADSLGKRYVEGILHLLAGDSTATTPSLIIPKFHVSIRNEPASYLVHYSSN